MSEVRESFNTLAGTISLEWWEDCFDGAERPAVIQYDIADGENEDTWYAVIDNHRRACTIREGTPDASDLRLRLSGNDWLAIAGNRATVWSLLAAGRIGIDGDARLLGIADLLGLLGNPVTAKEVAAHERDPWVAQTPSFVVPRVLSAGAVNHEKWRYFVAQGELRAVVSRVTWRVWRNTRTSRYARDLGPILRGLLWRSALLGVVPAPWYWLPVGFVVFLLALSAFVMTFWWLSVALLAGIVVVGYAATSSFALREGAGTLVTRLSRDDAEFFRFALEQKLIRIDHVPWGAK